MDPISATRLRVARWLATVVLAPWLVLASSATTASESSDRVRVANLSYAPPPAWIAHDGDGLRRNLGKVEMDPATVERLLADRERRALSVAAYSKHDPGTLYGFIPTINVVLLGNPRTSFEAFRRDIEHSARALGESLDRYEMGSGVTELRVAGRRALAFGGSYDLSLREGPRAGEAGRIVNRTVVIPNGTTFLQVSMLDTEPSENTGAFDAFLDSFSFDE